MGKAAWSYWAESVALIGIVTSTLLAVSLLASGCAGLPTNPPAYVKEIGAYQEGDGIAIWFSLADAAGAYTTADGTVVVEIIEEVTDWVGFDMVEREHILYHRQLSVTADEFVRTKVGMGAFEHEVILYPYGRVAKGDLDEAPEDDFGLVKVRVVFTTPNGQKLELTESAFLPD